MKLFKGLFSGGQRRSNEREEIHPFHKIRVEIANEQFRLADYSEKGLSCDREIPSKKPFPIREGETITADFLIFGHRKATTRVKILWIKDASFGGKVVDTEEFAEFQNQYLTYVKSK